MSRLLPSRSVLVTCIGATIGKTGFARVKCATNQQINALVTDDNEVLPEYVFWLMCSPWGQDQIVSNSSVTTLPILNKGRYEKLPMPMAPLDEQHEIVRRVEGLFKLTKLACPGPVLDRLLHGAQVSAERSFALEPVS